MTINTLFRWTLGLLVAGSFTAMSVLAVDATKENPDLALPAKKVVKDVRVESTGGTSLDEARIRANIGTRVGGAYSDEQIERDIKALYATGSFENVDIVGEEVKGGVVVTIKVSARGAIGEVSFIGNSVFDEKKLKKEVEIKTGDPVDDAKLFLDQNKIRDLYAEKGFPDVGISYKLEPMSKGFTRVVYSINEGQKGLINDIKFEGLTAVKPSKILSKLKLKERHFYNFWSKSTKLSNESLQEDIRTVERAVQDQGYVYAKVAQVRREPVKGDKVDVVFVVDEGRRYVVSEVVLEGNKVFTRDELYTQFDMDAGQAYSATTISGDETKLSYYYGSRGYADARVETSILPAGKDSVKVLYRVTEGEISHIRKIDIEGNDRTKDHVIRRELAFSPGEEFNTRAIDTSKKRLENMGYFSTVDFRNNPTGTQGLKDVSVTVAEKPTGSINVGAGFSSIQSIFGQFSLTQTNFDLFGWPHMTGGGQRFNLEAIYGTKRQDFSISVVEPWFLGQRLSLGGDLFYRDLYYLSDYFDQVNIGGSVNLRKPLGEHAYIEGVYTLQNIKIRGFDTQPSGKPVASDLLRQEEGTYLQSKLELAIVHDSRDSVYLTRHGHKVEIGGMYSGSSIGGDVGVTGFHISGTQYVTLPYDVILSFDGSYSTVSAQGGDRLPIFERLFLGGANNLRGFKYRDVGPKDVNGEPLGGDSSAFASIEANFPIIQDGDNPKVRGAIFYDVGQVSGGEAGSIGGGGTNSDVGIGLRLYLIPGTPIRLDYGVPVQHDAGTSKNGHFNFNMGYKF